MGMQLRREVWRYNFVDEGMDRHNILRRPCDVHTLAYDLRRSLDVACVSSFEGRIRHASKNNYITAGFQVTSLSVRQCIAITETGNIPSVTSYLHNPGVYSHVHYEMLSREHPAYPRKEVGYWAWLFDEDTYSPENIPRLIQELKENGPFVALFHFRTNQNATTEIFTADGDLLNYRVDYQPGLDVVVKGFDVTWDPIPHGDQEYVGCYGPTRGVEKNGCGKIAFDAVHAILIPQLSDRYYFGPESVHF